MDNVFAGTSAWARITPKAVTIALSVVLHAGALWSLSLANSDEETGDVYEFEVDITMAPEAPEADELAPDQKPEPEPEPEPAPDPDPDPDPDPEPEPEPLAVFDAGPQDATPDARVPALDAGPGDAAPTDAQGRDGGVEPRDGGVIASNRRDGGSGDAGPGNDANSEYKSANKGPTTVGVGVDLAPLTPPRDHLGVVIRWDRMRGTQWAKRAEKILKPMPDYKVIIGDRSIEIADRFDLLMISSSDPNDVTKTNLAARSTLSPAKLREFLAHADAPIAWSPVAGGALGKIGKSSAFNKGDKRVYLTPIPGWVLLADPKHLSKLITARAGDLDVVPAPSSLPAWMLSLPRVVKLTGEKPTAKAGPAVALSMRGLPSSLALPMVGELPAPRHLTLGLWTDPLGLIARGTMRFSTEARAIEFVTAAQKAKQGALGSKITALALRQFHAFHAVKGLSLKRSGARVSFATSVSVADGIAMTQKAAEQTERWYSRNRAPKPKARGADGGPSNAPDETIELKKLPIPGADAPSGGSIAPSSDSS